MSDPIIREALVLLILSVAGLAVWYLAVRFNQPELKPIAGVLVALPVLVVGVQISLHFFDWGLEFGFQHVSRGPAEPRSLGDA